jgi:ABC-type sugar transport system substrate-binding protein
MKKTFFVMVIAAVCLLAAGCSSLTVPIAATANPAGSKIGRASGQIWFGFFGTADAGIQAAAKNGGITSISTVDLTKRNGFLGLWVEYEAVVTGE